MEEGLITIKIDRQTLPKDGQKIKWQTNEDFNNEVWKTGTFCEGDDLFCVGFQDEVDKWDQSFNVIHWKPLTVCLEA